MQNSPLLCLIMSMVPDRLYSSNVRWQMFLSKSTCSMEDCVNIRSNFSWQNIHHERFIEDSEIKSVSETRLGVHTNMCVSTNTSCGLNLGFMKWATIVATRCYTYLCNIM